MIVGWVMGAGELFMVSSPTSQCLKISITKLEIKEKQGKN